MSIDINKNEALKLLDAIQAYQKNYALTAPIVKTLQNLEKKLNSIVND